MPSRTSPVTASFGARRARPVWRHSRGAGNVTRYTLKGISKVNHVFGVAAVDRDDNASAASFARPLRPR